MLCLDFRQKAGAVTKEPMVENAPGHGCGHNIIDGTTGLLTSYNLEDCDGTK